MRIASTIAKAVQLLVLIAVVPSAAVAEEKLYLFTENYPPYNLSTTGQGFAHEAGDIAGICSDIVKVMMSNVDYDYAMKMRDWSRSYDWVQGRENHALFCTARTDERENEFQWVGPLAPIKWTLFAAPGSDIKLSSLDEARQYEIAGYKGDVMSDYLVAEGFNVIMSMSGEQNARRLALGQADLWVTDGLVGPKVAREEHDIEGLVPVLVFRETPMYLAVSNETAPEIVADLQRGLDQARASGSLEGIEERYR